MLYNPGPQRFLGFQFRVLRHENVEPVIDSCHHAFQITVRARKFGNVLRDHQLETPNGVRYVLLQSVVIEGLSWSERQGMLAKLKFDCPKPFRGKAFSRCKLLEEGMLCSLLALHDDGALNVIHCVVDFRCVEVRRSFIFSFAKLGSQSLGPDEFKVASPHCQRSCSAR